MENTNNINKDLKFTIKDLKYAYDIASIKIVTCTGKERNVFKDFENFFEKTKEFYPIKENKSITDLLQELENIFSIEADAKLYSKNDLKAFFRHSKGNFFQKLFNRKFLTFNHCFESFKEK